MQDKNKYIAQTEDNSAQRYAAGLKYEHYVASLYEQAGYEVIRNGDKGVRDGGIDVIVFLDSKVRYIQCKYFKPWRRIHVDVVHQLHGAALDKHEDPSVPYDMYIYTTASLDDEAQRAAAHLGIHVQRTPMLNVWHRRRRRQFSGSAKHHALVQ